MTTYDVQLSPWKSSQNGGEFCQFNDLPDEIRSQLQQEDKYTNTIDGFRYTVKITRASGLFSEETLQRILQEQPSLSAT